MTITADPDADLARLHTLEAEHRLTLRLLAVAVEQLLHATEAEQVCVSAAAVNAARPLAAWRDGDTDDYVLTVAP